MPFLEYLLEFLGARWLYRHFFRHGHGGERHGRHKRRGLLYWPIMLLLCAVFLLPVLYAVVLCLAVKYTWRGSCAARAWWQARQAEQQVDEQVRDKLASGITLQPLEYTEEEDWQ